ncbi:metallophosphoesterase [Mesobacillus maritimus]|uniref:metallophosphoesterase n=1 Tax=Mesobacillus maritimus TaxID=1643336 RepID=UPI002040F7AF|nr:metallophosphoesterase [Mesobacillus maritimus]MCM3585910.1 metallophosphoesterase [Mesobacillus maritimus]
MKFLFMILVLSILFKLIKKSYQNTKDVQINEITVNKHLSPEQNPSLSILQLSDLHLENISISPEELYQKIINQPIDIIALTGDFLDRSWTIPKLIPYLEVLNKINARYGMYAVLGNHDYVLKKKNLDKLIQTLEDHNCKVLRNQNETILVHGRPVNIIGVDDFSTKRSDLTASYANLSDGTNLVLTHDPNVVLNMKDYHFDYLLSGHLHGGQICYPKAYHLVKMGKLPRMNIIKGMHMIDGKPYYISEGLGQTGVNIRVGSRPEITFHKLPLISNTKQSQQAI